MFTLLNPYKPQQKTLLFYRSVLPVNQLAYFYNSTLPLLFVSPSEKITINIACFEIHNISNS